MSVNLVNPEIDTREESIRKIYLSLARLVELGDVAVEDDAQYILGAGGSGYIPRLSIGLYTGDSYNQVEGSFFSSLFLLEGGDSIGVNIPFGDTDAYAGTENLIDSLSQLSLDDLKLVEENLEIASESRIPFLANRVVQLVMNELNAEHRKPEGNHGMRTKDFTLERNVKGGMTKYKFQIDGNLIRMTARQILEEDFYLTVIANISIARQKLGEGDFLEFQGLVSLMATHMTGDGRDSRSYAYGKNGIVTTSSKEFPFADTPTREFHPFEDFLNSIL